MLTRRQAVAATIAAGVTAMVISEANATTVTSPKAMTVAEVNVIPFNKGQHISLHEIDDSYDIFVPIYKVPVNSLKKYEDLQSTIEAQSDSSGKPVVAFLFEGESRYGWQEVGIVAVTKGRNVSPLIKEAVG